jgi:hypothetical protein
VTSDDPRIVRLTGNMRADLQRVHATGALLGGVAIEVHEAPDPGAFVRAYHETQAEFARAIERDLTMRHIIAIVQGIADTATRRLQPWERVGLTRRRWVRERRARNRQRRARGRPA